MMGWRRTTPCERASHWISLELDGELSELEQAGLVRHVARCAHCRQLQDELRGMTALLRATPLAEPIRQLTFASPRRQRARVASRLGFVAAVGAIVAAVAALVTTSSPNGLLGQSSQALSFVNQREQIRFARNKTQATEPLQLVALGEPLAASVPANSRRALR
jgi:ferric-dicitrate binding protein FerR (iron transport regulator)